MTQFTHPAHQHLADVLLGLWEEDDLTEVDFHRLLAEVPTVNRDSLLVFMRDIISVTEEGEGRDMLIAQVDEFIQ